jgi:predicted amidohydrolase YtcJ
MADTAEHGEPQHQQDDKRNKGGVSRRGLLIGGGAAAAAGAIGAATGGPAFAIPGNGNSDGPADLILYNGKIHTMDDGGSVVNAIKVRDGRIVAVGANANTGNAAKKIDLGGRTVIPGLIESHVHVLSLANRPGYHTADWELAADIPELLTILAARVKDVPEGQFITAMGAGAPNFLNPPTGETAARLPTIAELDSNPVLATRPVFLYQGGGGPARTNSLGKAFFEGLNDGITVDPVTGVVTPHNRALYHLRIRQTFDDKKRSALDAMAFSSSLGLTTVLDEVLPPINAWTVVDGQLVFNPALLEPAPTHGLTALNHFTLYDPWLALHQEGLAFLRLQINFLHSQGMVAGVTPGPAEDPLRNQLPELRQRLRNQFPDFGDDLVRTYGIGEWGAPVPASTAVANYPVWFEAQRLIAKARWHNENAQFGSAAAVEVIVAAYEAMEAEFGIKDLRWGLQHADQATPDQLARLKALNVSISASGWRYANRGAARTTPIGPMFRDIVDSGIKYGLHGDGVHIATLNPWFALHFATTGLNAAGNLINPGQLLTRQEAMRAFTRGNAWYLGREDDLGSLETGKLADLVVLDKDYFAVSDDEAKRIKPIFTVIGGQIVHDTGELRGFRDWSHDHNHVYEH